VKVYPRMRAHHRFWVSQPPEAVAACLQHAIDDGFRGSVQEGRFQLSQTRSSRNSWRPKLNGRLLPSSGGTVVDVQASVHPLVLGFTIIHGFLLLGIAWVMGILAFSAEVSGALRALEAAAGADGTAQPLSAPQADGAELNAPWSLGAEADLGGVHFTLRAAPGWLDTNKTARLSLERAGVVLRQGRSEVELPWHALADARAVDGALHLGERVIDASAHPDAHLAWLVAYLRDRAARLGASEAERVAFEENARRLAALQASRAPER